MKRAVVVPFFAALAAGAPSFAQQNAHQAVTPVQKVVQMLQGMVDNAEQDKHAEAVQFAGFKQFCDDVSLEKQTAIEKADEKIETLQAHILKYDTNVEKLGSEIMQHNADIAGWENDTEAATVVRKGEKSDYGDMHRNYSESVTALTHAIAVLKKQTADTAGTYAGAPALLQAVRAQMPLEASQAIQTFLQRSSEDPDETYYPPTTAYEFRGSGLITMLEGLLDKFRTKVATLESDEVARRHAFTTLVQDLTDSIAGAKESIKSKTTFKLNDEQLSIEAKADLADVSATRADDITYLNDLTATCTSKASDFAARQKLRTEEIEALEKAIEIMSGMDVTGAAEKHLPKAAALVKKSSSLVQTRSSAPNQAAMAAVAVFLKSASERIGSKSLAALAASAQDDPFGKVKKLIEELIDRLISQAGEEAEHKGWCDTELATNAHTRKTKTEEVETLTAQIDGLQADIGMLGKDLLELAAAVAQIEADVAKQTDLRNNESATNNQTVVEAQAAQAAVTQAVGILKDFYAKAAEATAFTQKAGKQQPEAPEIFDDTPYTGMQSDTGGVLGMLEVIQSDFVRLEQDTVASETAAQQEYDQFMEESAIDKTQKDKDIEHKTSSKQAKEMDVTNKKEDLESASKILSEAETAFEKLKPACLDTGMTYEERVTRREDEIESLKEALRILSGDDAVIGQRY